MPEMFQSSQGTIGKFATNRADAYDFGTDEEGYFPVTRLKTQYIDYLATKQLEIEEQQQARHYYHGAQYTAREIEILRSRKQPIITFNRVGRKIDTIVGLLQRIKQDPKAFPRSPKHADGAEIATQTVRSILQASGWDYIDPFCSGQAATEGIGGVELKLIDGDHDDPDVALDYVFGDDFFYDPRSFRADFSDARFMGISKWLDIEEAVELFPDQEEEIRSLMVDTGFDLSTHSDREFKWVYINEQRLRLVEHWYKFKGKWKWAFYCGNTLLDQGESPFVDQRRRSMCRFVMFSNAVDHEGDRYGFTRNLKGPQDEMNQRRSKALFMTNVTAMYLEKGAVDNVEDARRQRARPDGIIEYNRGFQRPEDVQKAQDLAQQLALMQDARQEIDSFANINPQLMTDDRKDEHSGVAINMLQKAGIAELGSFLRNYRNWKWRVYRAVWNIAVRNWQAERWVRVTDNDGLAQFIQINGMEDDEYGDPLIVNAIGALDVEIDMDEGPDEASIMHDVYDQIRDDQTIPFMVKLEFMPMAENKKQKIRSMLQQNPNPLQQKAMMQQLQKTDADIEDKRAQATERRARSMTDVARAAHLASEAHLNVQQTVQEGLMQASNVPQPMNPMSSQGNPFGGTPQSFQPQPQPPGGLPQQGAQ
jgi:hypothetical protein